VFTEGKWNLACVYLLAMAAPLEVYRTVAAGIDVSLFRLSLLIAVGVLLASARGQLRELLANRRRGLRYLLGWITNPLVAVYLLLACVFVLAMLVHPINTFLGQRQAAQIVIGVVALALIVRLAQNESFERVAVAVVVGAVLPVLAAIWQALAPRLGASGALPLLSHLPVASGLQVTRQALASFGPIGARSKGTFGDPNHFGIYLVFTTCLAFALMVLAGSRENRRAQVSFGAMAAASAATLVATFSRSAWIAAVIGAVVVAMGLIDAWRTGLLRPPPRRVAVFAAIGAVALSVGVIPSVAERVAPSSEINVISDRTHASTMRFAYDQFIAHPVLGIGPGGIGAKLSQRTRTSGAHSTYLTVAAELGIVGLVALLMAAATTLLYLARAYRSMHGTSMVMPVIALAGAYIGFLGANVTYDVWWDDFHWLMLGAVAVLATGTASASTDTKASTNGDVKDMAYAVATRIAGQPTEV
jgi:O-antigen ligase